MGIQDTIKGDMGIFLDATNGFAVPVAYTPQGGLVRNISGIVGELIHAEFRDGNQSMKWNKRTLEISAVDDIAGVTVPKVLSRDGAGDSCVIDGTTYYVVDILQEGKSSGTWMHLLMLSDKKIGVTRA